LKLRVLADAQLLPRGGTQAGDRHLKFYETRDNLMEGSDQFQEGRIGSYTAMAKYARSGVCERHHIIQHAAVREVSSYSYSKHQ
jgi:hypothetical protein